MHSSWKIYFILFMTIALVQSQWYRQRLRDALNTPQSVQPLTTYELVASSLGMFTLFIVLETLVKNDVF